MQPLNLLTLTLYGNPIERLANYRLWIVAIIPTLKNLDTSLITLLERDNARTLVQGRRTRRLPVLKEEEMIYPPPLKVAKGEDEEHKS